MEGYFWCGEIIISCMLIQTLTPCLIADVNFYSISIIDSVSNHPSPLLFYLLKMIAISGSRLLLLYIIIEILFWDWGLDTAAAAAAAQADFD